MPHANERHGLSLVKGTMFFTLGFSAFSILIFATSGGKLNKGIVPLVHFRRGAALLATWLQQSPDFVPRTFSLRRLFFAKPRGFREVADYVAGFDRSLIVTQVNGEYLDFLENWYTSVSRFGYGSKILFIAEDRTALDYLKRHYPRQTVQLPHILDEFPLGMTKSGNFNSIVGRRPFYLKAVLDLNITLLYNDIDSVWLEDPLPFFKGEYDMWLQEDGRIFDGAFERFPDGQVGKPIRVEGSAYQLCTCLMMIRPTEASKSMLERWGQGIRQEIARVGRPVANQVLWNKAVLEVPESALRIGVLPIMHFPSGCIYFGGTYEWCRQQQQVFQKSQQVGLARTVVVHNNWYPGHEAKLRRFKEHHLWFLEDLPNDQMAKTSPALSAA